MSARSLRFFAMVLLSFGGLRVDAAPAKPSKEPAPSATVPFDTLIGENIPLTMNFAGNGMAYLVTNTLQPKTFLDTFLFGYSSSQTTGMIESGTTAVLVDTRQVPTIFGSQQWLKVATPKGLSGWLPVDSLAFSPAKKDGSQEATLEVRIVPWWKTNSYSVALLTLGLSFGAFFFGIHLRNVIFQGTSWRPLQHQLLLAVPLSLVTVPSELLAYTKVLPTGGPLQLAAAFLVVLGAVMIQGILLPELSWKLIEKKMRKPPRRRQETAKRSPIDAVGAASIAVTPRRAGVKPRATRKKISQIPEVTTVLIGAIEPLVEGC